MSSEVKTRNADFMESQSENESLQVRIREIEDENQELRAQNLIQNRTILELRNELVLLRIQMSEMSDTSAFLRERVRSLSSQQEQDDRTGGQITAPPLMAPPPVPPPLPPTRLRISPRQVGAGEALTTPLGVTLTSPPRHRIKRDCRQGFYRATRSPYRRLDATEPGPSTPSPFLSSERPNYFVGLRIIPQFQTSFVCSQNQSSGYSDSASDSSGSDDIPQVVKKVKQKPSSGEALFKKPATFLKDFELLKSVRNLNHQRVRQTILQSYNLSLPSANNKFSFPLQWERKSGQNPPLPSTSAEPTTDDTTPRNTSKISDCVQYTFPTIHEGLHHGGTNSVTTNGGQPSRLRKYKKSIPYLRPNDAKILDEAKKQLEGDEVTRGRLEATNSGSLSSIEETGRFRNRPPALLQGEISSDLDQDGFQADESSNCLTSNENSLEKICIGESTAKKNS